MTETEIRTAVLDALGAVAPELRATPPAGGADLREDVELDSMDFLNFVIGIAKRTGVEVPESDYPQLFTLDGAIAYVKARSAST